MIWLLTSLVKAICWFISIWPRRLQVWVGLLLGWTWFYVIPFRRKVVLANIEKAFPEWNQERVWKTARRNYENYGCGLIESLSIPYFTKEKFDKLFVVENLDIFEKASAQKNGVFLLTLHLGSWEIMAATCGYINVPLHMVVKKIKSKWVNEFWVGLRMSRGVKLIDDEKSSFQILRVIRSGETVGFIMDQFLGPPVGSKVIYFGHETGAPAGLALFADRTRAPVIPVYNVRQADGRIKITFEPEIPFMEQGSRDQNISFMTQVYTGKIEEIVRKYPEQWLWLHKRWKPFRS